MHKTKFFGGIDTYYALYPFERKNGSKSFLSARFITKNNTLEVIPIITNDADEFLFVSKYVQELG
jgi:hypothetical protein